MSSEIQDYNKWTRDFSNSFGYSSQRFLNFFSAFESLIDEYCENFSLLPPCESKTNDFLYRFIPEIASKIYRLSNLKDDALEFSFNQLLKILSLCVFLAEQCDFKLNKTMKLILDQKQNIYKYNDQLFSMLCELFVSYEYYQRLVARCRDSKPNIKNLSLVFAIRAKILSSVSIELSEVLPILPDFILQFKGDSIRAVDSNKLNKIIQKYIIPSFPTKTNQGNININTDFSPFFNFCKILILSRNLDKQLLGLKFLNSYLNNSAKNMSSLNAWFSNNDNPEPKQLLEYLTQTPELHNEIIKSIEPLFLYLSSSHLVDVGFVDQILQTTKKMEKEEANSFFKLIVKCLSSMSNENKNIIKDFISTHKDSPELLAAFILNSSMAAYSIECISYLFANKAFNVIKSVINNQTKKLYIDEAMRVAEKNQKAKQIDFEEVKIASDTLTYLINISTAYKSDFGDPREFISKVITNFSFPGNKSFLFTILKSYYAKSRQSLEIEILPEIFDFQHKESNDDFWNFLIEVIKANQKYSLKKDVVDSLYNIIDEISNDYFPITSSTFIIFFRLLFIIKCSYEYIIYLPSSHNIEKFNFHKFPKNYFPLLLKLYFSTKEHELMNSFMLELLTKYTNFPTYEIYNILTANFIPKLIQSTDNNMKYYIVKLIYDTLATNEKGIKLEDYGERPKRRHCEIMDEVVELSLVMESKDKKNLTLIRKIHSSIEENCDDFLKRVRTIMNDQKADACYLGIYLNKPAPLKNSSVSKSCNINVIGVYRPLKVNILTLRLTDSDSILLEPLFKILNNIKINQKDDLQLAEATYKLLQFLPSFQGFNIDLSKCQNYFVLIYCIQVFASLSKMDDGRLKSLVDIFHSRKYKEADLDIILIFIRFFEKDQLPQYLELLIDPLFECININKKEKGRIYDIYNLNNKNNKDFDNLNQILMSISNKNSEDRHEMLSEKAIILLHKLIKLRNDADSILSNRVEDIVEMTLNVDSSTAREVYEICDKIPNIKNFFTMFIQRIPVQLSDNALIFKLFYNFWQKLYDGDFNAKDQIGKAIFQKCIDLIGFSSLDIYRLCLIFRKMVKSYLIFSKDSQNVLKLDSDILNYIDQFVTKLFDLHFIRDNSANLTPIFRFIKKIGKLDGKMSANHRLLDIIDKCLLSLFSKVGKSNHYNMSKAKYPHADFTGLQNLGSTCFINTIVQPFFYTYQFRYNVLFDKDSSKEEKDKKNIMYDLFVKMLTTQRGYVKMKDFVRNFEKDIETNRQQDCVEFLLILSEKLGKNSYNLIKGVLVDHLTSSKSSGVENDSCDEDFIHLSVNVQKFTNLEDSLKSLFGNTVVISDNNISVSQSNDSNIQKYSRIKVAPQFLMICLNRFEYNLKTFQKIKINSKFSFPFVLDVSEYVEANDEKNDDVFAPCKGVYKYELYAVSLHNGSGDSGHYTALVKICGNWVEFNDRSSRKISEKDVMAMSFGTDNRKEAYNERNAYVLYYRRILVINDGDQENDNVNTNNSPAKVIDLYDEKIIDQIFLRFSEKIERSEHLSMYNDELEDNFKNYSISDLNSNAQVLISYFFNVYCHSSSRDCKEFIEKLIQKLNAIEKVSGEALFNFLLNNSDGKNYKDTYCPKLIETFMKCKIEPILLSIRNLILYYSENTKCKNVLTLLISNLSLFQEKPEKIELIAPLFLGYVTGNQTQKVESKKNHVQDAREMKWGQKILEFIDFCSQKISEFNQKKVRLADLLLILKELLKTNNKPVEGKEASDLKSFSQSIIASIKKNIKFLLMNAFNSVPLLELFSIATSILSPSSSSAEPHGQFIKVIEDSARSDAKNKLVMNFIIGLIECDADNELISDCLAYETGKTEISTFFKDFIRSTNNSNSILNQYLADNYSQYILPELLSSKKDTRLKAEHLTYDIFIEVKPPTKSPHYSNSRSTQNRTPTQSLIQFSKELNEHCFEKVFEIINQANTKVKTVRKSNGIAITTTSCPKDYDSYFFENFLRVVKWTIKRVKNCTDVKLEKSILSDDQHYVKFFNKIYDVFLFIDANNNRATKRIADANFLAAIDIFKVFPYDQILNATKAQNEASFKLEGNEIVEKIEKAILSSLDFVPNSGILIDNISKILLILSTVNNNNKTEKPTSSNNLLLRIYENNKFVNFFKVEKKLRQDESRFDKFYSSTISTVLINSEIYRKESLIILDNPLNFSLEYSLLTEVLTNIYNLLPGKFIIKVINWIIKNVNEKKDPPSFMGTVLSINSSVKNDPSRKNGRIPFEELFMKNTSPLKIYSSQPLSSLKADNSRIIDKNCDFLRSLDNIGYKGRMKYDDSMIYFRFIKYICKECALQAQSDNNLLFLSSIADEVLMKLINRMSLIDGKNVTLFAFELSAFFDFVIDQKKFEFISQFVNGIFPLSDFNCWLSYTKIFDSFLKINSITVDQNDEIADSLSCMHESIFLVTKNLLTEVSIGYKVPSAYVQSYLKEEKPEVKKRIIDELVGEHNATNNVNTKKIIIDNLKRIIRWFPDYYNYSNSLIKL